MLGRIGSLVARVAEEAGAVVGLRFGTEEPRYTSEKVTHGLEIRNYGPRIAAETTVFGDEDKALSDGFRRLAGYIFGGNHGNAKIAMTAPVARQSGQKIAMTAPVSKISGADGGSVVRFFMPAGWTMDTLPEPNDEEVGLVTVPAETVAVLRFTGDRGSAAVAARTTELLEALKDTASSRLARRSGGSTIRPGPSRSGGATRSRFRSLVADPPNLACVLVAHRCCLVVESVKFGVGITQRVQDQRTCSPLR